MRSTHRPFDENNHDLVALVGRELSSATRHRGQYQSLDPAVTRAELSDAEVGHSWRKRPLLDTSDGF